MSFGLFASDSTSTTNVTTNNNSNSFNTTNSSSHVVSDAGNISLNLGAETTADKLVPLVAIVAVGFGLLLFLRE